MSSMIRVRSMRDVSPMQSMPDLEKLWNRRANGETETALAEYEAARAAAKRLGVSPPVNDKIRAHYCRVTTA